MNREMHLTPQRQAVYDVIVHSHDHPTAADIMDRLRDKGHKISYATVYNSLKFLTDEGMILELRIGESANRYDARTEAHHHIVCERCGRVDELLTPLPASYWEQIQQDTGYEIRHMDVVAKGLCPDCRTKAH